MAGEFRRPNGADVLWAMCVLLSPGGPLAAQAVRDSGGVRIVENARPVLSADRAWRVDSRPEVDIGGNEATAGDTLYEFVRVNGAVRLTDGRIAVQVDGSKTIRFYDQRGRYLRSAGRSGDGPGEFRQLMGLRVLKGDTLFITDLGEVELYTGDGRFVRRGASRATNERGFVFPGAVLDDGWYVGFAWGDPGRSQPGRRVLSLPLVRVSADGRRSDTLGMLPARETAQDGNPFAGSRVFAPSAALAAGGGRIYYGFPDRYEVTVFDRNGRTVALIRRDARAARVTDAEREAYRKHAMAYALADRYHPTTREQAERGIARLEFADQLPAFASLLVDRTGHLWVKRYDFRDSFRIPGPSATETIDVPSQWDVFDSQGVWQCTVQLPARFTPLDIGADHVLGLARDADDIESVHLYRLRKP